jgi:hypothetical protein
MKLIYKTTPEDYIIALIKVDIICMDSLISTRYNNIKQKYGGLPNG